MARLNPNPPAPAPSSSDSVTLDGEPEALRRMVQKSDIQELRECGETRELLAKASSAINARAEVVDAINSQAACDLYEIFGIVNSHKMECTDVDQVQKWEDDTNASLQSGVLAHWKAIAEETRQRIASYERTINRNWHVSSRRVLNSDMYPTDKSLSKPLLQKMAQLSALTTLEVSRKRLPENIEERRAEPKGGVSNERTLTTRDVHRLVEEIKKRKATHAGNEPSAKRKRPNPRATAQIKAAISDIQPFAGSSEPNGSVQSPRTPIAVSQRSVSLAPAELNGADPSPLAGSEPPTPEIGRSTRQGFDPSAADGADYSAASNMSSPLQWETAEITLDSARSPSVDFDISSYAEEPRRQDGIETKVQNGQPTSKAGADLVYQHGSPTARRSSVLRRGSTCSEPDHHHRAPSRDDPGPTSYLHIIEPYRNSDHQRQASAPIGIEQGAPASTVEGALSSLETGKQLSSTAMHMVLSALERLDVRVMDPSWLRISTESTAPIRPLPTAIRLVVIPLHHAARQHWTIAIIDKERQAVEHYDSAGRTSVLPVLYESRLSQTANNMFQDDMEWTVTQEESPQQVDANSCGIFACVAAMYCVAGKPGQPCWGDQASIDIWRECFRSMVTSRIIPPHLQSESSSPVAQPQDSDLPLLQAIPDPTFADIDTTISAYTSFQTSIERLSSLNVSTTAMHTILHQLHSAALVESGKLMAASNCMQAELNNLVLPYIAQVEGYETENELCDRGLLKTLVDRRQTMDKKIERKGKELERNVEAERAFARGLKAVEWEMENQRRRSVVLERQSLQQKTRLQELDGVLETYRVKIANTLA